MFSRFTPDKTEDNRREHSDTDSEHSNEDTSVFIKPPGQHRSFTSVMETK